VDGDGWHCTFYYTKNSKAFDVFLTLICYKKHMTTTPYCSYLLRLWLEPNDPPEWRAMLESPSGGERHGFASFEALMAFLEQEMARLEKEQKHRDARQDHDVF
jgi:hypothetical protein